MNTTTETTIFEELFKAAEKHVKNYRTDFDHDKKSIEANPGAKFIHIARRNGTSLNVFYSSDKYPKQGERVKHLFSSTADRKELLISQLDMLNYYLKEDPLKVHFFNGEKLVKISIEKAKDIYLTYYNFMLTKWEQEEKQTA